MTPQEQSAFQTLVRKCQSTLIGPWGLSPGDWVGQVILGAQQCVRNNAVPSVVIAQAILESGWGAHPLLFGFKATAQDMANGDAVQVPTHEVIQGVLTPVMAYFFNDLTIAGNFGRYFDYLARMKPDTAQFCPADTAGFIARLQSPTELAYSTSPTYGETIMEIIQANGLSAFDHV